MTFKFMKITLALAFGWTLSSCGEPDPLQAQDFLDELKSLNIEHFQVARDFDLREHSTSPLLIEVCLEDFSLSGFCNGVGFYINQFDSQHDEWELARETVIDLSGGSTRVEINRNLMLTNHSRHLVDSAEMRRILTAFKNFE